MKLVAETPDLSNVTPLVVCYVLVTGKSTGRINSTGNVTGF